MNFIAYAARIRDACYMQPDLNLYDYLKFVYENTTEWYSLYIIPRPTKGVFIEQAVY